MLDHLKRLFLSKYAKSLIRHLLTLSAGFIVAKAPALEPVATAVTENLDTLSAAGTALVLSGIAGASSVADKKKEDK
jgi:hypothetical protein